MALTAPKWFMYLKSLNHTIMTKHPRRRRSVGVCRGSLAWLGRQTHNLETTGPHAHCQKSRARIPPPAPNLFFQVFCELDGCFKVLLVWFAFVHAAQELEKAIRVKAVAVKLVDNHVALSL